MKALYATINDILTGDATLRGLLGYKEFKDVPVGKEGLQAGISQMTIRRGYQTEGNWDKLLTYYFQPDIVMQDFSANIRNLPLVVVLFDRDNDLNLYEVAERVIFLLHEADLSNDGLVHSYGCHYAGQIQSPVYEQETKSYKMSIRFSIKARKEI